MAIFDFKLPASIAHALHLPVSDPRRQQIKVLKKLLRKARFTEFGQRYRFDEILLSRHPGKKFQQLVPPIITIKFTMPGGIKQKMAYRMFAGRE